MVFDGGGHVRLTRLRRPLTGIESVIPVWEWDAFKPLGTNFVVNSTNNNHAALLAILCTKPRPNTCSYLLTSLNTWASADDILVEGTILHSSVAKDENTYVMVTELSDTIKIRHTITRSFVRYTFVTCLLTYLFWCVWPFRLYQNNGVFW